MHWKAEAASHVQLRRAALELRCVLFEMTQRSRSDATKLCNSGRHEGMGKVWPVLTASLRPFSFVAARTLDVAVSVGLVSFNAASVASLRPSRSSIHTCVVISQILTRSS